MQAINSKTSVASETAAQMSRAANAVSAIEAVESAEAKTTVAGMTNAQTTVKQTKEVIQQLVTAFNQDIDRITLVASEFARVDEDVAAGFDLSEGVPSIKGVSFP